MINIHQDLQKRKLKSKMTMQVHDELVFDALRSEAEEVKNIIENRMKNALKTEIPIVVEIGEGLNWLEAH